MSTPAAKTAQAILDSANARGFVLVTPLGTFPADIVGAGLDFPIVQDKTGTIRTEVSWALAERLSTGESVQVRF